MYFSKLPKFNRSGLTITKDENGFLVCRYTMDNKCTIELEIVDSWYDPKDDCFKVHPRLEYSYRLCIRLAVFSEWCSIDIIEPVILFSRDGLLRSYLTPNYKITLSRKTLEIVEREQ